MASSIARAAQRPATPPSPPPPGPPPPDATASAPPPPPAPPPLAAAAADDPSLAPFIAQIADKRFTCTTCGKCCTGSGDVWVTEAEALAISRRTRRPLAAFTKSFSRAKGWRLLRDRPPSSGVGGVDRLQACVFLSSADDRTCTIHDARPAQCRLYPWWPGLMDAREWAEEGGAVCEGFDHPDAPPTDVADAARQLREATKLEAMRLASYGGRRGKGRGGAELEAGGALGARSADDMPPGPASGDGGGGGSKRERRRRKAASMYDRLMALLDGEGADGEGGGSGPRE
jgi:Fe-S-cluster containining protein